MGIYKVGEEEIFNAIKEALDGIEGDFSTEDLCSALDSCKGYFNTTGRKQNNEAKK